MFAFAIDDGICLAAQHFSVSQSARHPHPRHVEVIGQNGERPQP
jgi:hypothetical protein